MEIWGRRYESHLDSPGWTGLTGSLDLVPTQEALCLTSNPDIRPDWMLDWGLEHEAEKLWLRGEGRH